MSVVALVFCSPCGDRRGPLGKVRRTAQGLVFEAKWSTKEERAELRFFEADLRERTGRRVPFTVGGGVTLSLNAPPDLHQDWPARVRCPTHGFAEVDVDELRRQIASARPPEKAKLTVHHPG